MEVGEAVAFMLLLQMRDSLLRGHLLSLEGRPRLRNGFAPAIGDHDAVDCLAELYLLNAFSSRFTNPRKFLLYRGVCFVASWRRRPDLWRDAVSLARGDGEHALAHTADENGRVRLLYGFRESSQVRDRVVFAGEVHDFLRKELFDAMQRLFHPTDSPSGTLQVQSHPMLICL